MASLHTSGTNPTGALLALARDIAVTRVVARLRKDSSGRDAAVVEVTRNGKTSPDPVLQEPEDLERLVGSLLGPGRTFGPVSMRGLQGLAAIPPAADTPVLVLERLAPSGVAPEHDGTVPSAIAAAAAALLRAGAGVTLAGPSGAPVGTSIRSVCGRLGPSARLVVVEDGQRTPIRQDAIRIREASYETLRSLRHCVVIINRAVPPAISSLSGAVLVVVTARTPEAALARLAHGSASSARVLARIASDTAPLLLWLGAHARRLEAAYEVLPEADVSGLPALQMLAGTDPETGALVPTGAVPLDPALRDAWAAVGS
jgi:hypothetical protein